jgi:hypothetical protein
MGRSLSLLGSLVRPTARPSSDLCLTVPAPALDRCLHLGRSISFLLASTRASCGSLDFASVGAILISGMFALHVVEQCAKAHQLGAEVPPMAIPGVVGSDLALRTTAERGEDFVIGRSLQCCPHVDRGENDERSSLAQTLDRDAVTTGRALIVCPVAHEMTRARSYGMA